MSILLQKLIQTGDKKDNRIVEHRTLSHIRQNQLATKREKMFALKG